MPTKDTLNAATGLMETVEMEGDELAAYEAQRAIPEPPTVTLDDVIAAAVAKALAERGIK